MRGPPGLPGDDGLPGTTSCGINNQFFAQRSSIIINDTHKRMSHRLNRVCLCVFKEMLIIIYFILLVLLLIVGYRSK